MKVLGISGSGSSKALIIEIKVLDLERLLGSFYNHPIQGDDRKVSALESGDEVDIERLHSMTRSLEVICESLVNTNKIFEENSKVIIGFAEMVTSVAHEEGKNG